MDREFHAQSVSIRAMSAAFRANGFVLLRGAVPAHKVQRYREALDAIYRQYDVSPGDFAAFPAAQVEAIRQGDVSPSIFAALAGFTLEEYFRGRTLRALVKAEIKRAVPDLSTFMTVSPKPDFAIGGLALHTDGIIQGTAASVIALWSPLHACGVDAPGLAVLPASKERVIDYLRRKFPDKTIPGWCSTTEWNDTGAFDAMTLRDEFGDPWTPAMQPGDVMIFSNWTIHGSYVTPAMTKRRSAAIMRWTTDPRAPRPLWRRLSRKVISQVRRH